LPLSKFLMASIFSYLISSGPKKKEPRWDVWVKTRPHTHTKCGLRSPPQHHTSYKMRSPPQHHTSYKMRSPPQHHTSYKWSYYSAPLYIYKCLLKVLRPVRRPITTLDCVLVQGNNRALAARLGPEISFRVCLCVLQGPRHITKRWLSIQLFILLLMFCLETPNMAKFWNNRRAAEKVERGC
jgi:hypothetical protein